MHFSNNNNLQEAESKWKTRSEPVTRDLTAGSYTMVAGDSTYVILRLPIILIYLEKTYYGLVAQNMLKYDELNGCKSGIMFENVVFPP